MDSCFPPLATLSLKENGPNTNNDTISKDIQDINKYSKIEILQDLDLYYIRQIAHKLKELDLEQKIELEIKMREGSAKLLAASKQQAQSLEAARALLTSNERMSAYMAELQRRKKDPSSRCLSSTISSRARVSLSELRIPLMWRGVDHFKNKGDYRRFAVFCLARIGTEIFDTALICPVDRSLTDITFPDVMLFQNVPSDFKFTLEVYSHLLAEDLSIASTPRKLQRTLHSSISRTVGKKLAASLRDELHGRIGPQFQLVASAELTLEDIFDGVKTHDLKVNILENRNQELPLFGHFCCRLAAQPDCLKNENKSNEIKLKINSNSWLNTNLHLNGFNLFTESSKENESLPQDSIPIDKETRVKVAAEHQIIIERLCEGQDITWTIQFNSTEDQQTWNTLLTNTVNDHKRWERAAESEMHIPSPGSSRHGGFHMIRQGSLYDQTPLIEELAEEKTSVNNHRRTVQEIFGLTPSTSLSSCSSASSSPPTSFRDRSNSSSGLKATLRGHWPFKSSSDH